MECKEKDRLLEEYDRGVTEWAKAVQNLKDAGVGQSRYLELLSLVDEARARTQRAKAVRESQKGRRSSLGKQEGEVSFINANDVIAIISRRRAKFQAQRRSGPQEDMDEAARLIAEEYDSLLAEIEVAVANQPEAERRNNKAEAEILGDQGRSGG